MDRDNYEFVRSSIDDFAFRWHEFVDYHAYTQRISQLLHDFRNKEKQLLNYGS